MTVTFEDGKELFVKLIPSLVDFDAISAKIDANIPADFHSSDWMKQVKNIFSKGEPASTIIIDESQFPVIEEIELEAEPAAAE